jgi:hypothetical protein
MKTVRAIVCVLALCASRAMADAAPPAPTNLTATVLGNAIVLQWTPPPGAFLGYYLVAGLLPGTTIAANVLGPVPGFTAFPIPAGTYYFRVHSYDATGFGPPSNEVVAVVGGATPCLGPPAAPVGLTSTVSGSIVTLGFSPGAGGCPATNYVLQAGSAPGLSNIAVFNIGSTTGLTTAAPNGIYYVRIVAQNAGGTSPPSNEIVIRVGF